MTSESLTTINLALFTYIIGEMMFLLGWLAGREKC